jgi:cobalt-precorrin-5B (C1)-methyltransferase
MKKKLRTGYTTGTCAAAATKGAVLTLLGYHVEEASVHLPVGREALLSIERAEKRKVQASCLVRKDAGDDPDVTHGALIGSSVRWLRGVPRRNTVRLLGGTGVGVVTKPGLAVPVGQPAINPVPARMVVSSATEVLLSHSKERSVEITLFVPGGEDLAQRTFNPRLGIVGGISILGTTGIVTPYSHEAYKETIRSSLDIARATGCRHIILSTGSRSEQCATRQFSHLPESAFIQMGDHVAFALREASKRAFAQITVSVFFGKLVKIAHGSMNTHVQEGILKLDLLVQEAKKLRLPEAAITRMRGAHTAREAFGIIRSCGHHALIAHLCRNAIERMGGWVGGRLLLSLILFSFAGEPVWYGHDSTETKYTG